jgi:uncharacterized protein (DUF1786 family)
MITKEMINPGRRILAVDVGTGTQDILVFEEAKNPENCIKMVLPAMTQVLAKRVREIQGDIFLPGETMGGGPVAFALKEHVKKGHRVVMTETAARTIRDNLEEVREAGIEVVRDRSRPEGFQVVETMDVDFQIIQDLLDAVEEPFEFDYVGVAVQDHGYSEGVSDRVFRFQNFRRAVDSGARLEDLMYQDPPSYFSRMAGVLRTVKRSFQGPAFVVDTKIAAMAGAFYTSRTKPGMVMAVDVGNGHTTAAIISREARIEGVYEHHTSALTREKLEEHLRGFVEKTLTNRDVLEDGGHGCYNSRALGMEDIEAVLVTGPRRRLLTGSKTIDTVSPAPYGDVMMTGTAGIVEMILKRVEKGDMVQLRKEA